MSECKHGWEYDECPGCDGFGKIKNLTVECDLLKKKVEEYQQQTVDFENSIKIHMKANDNLKKELEKLREHHSDVCCSEQQALIERDALKEAILHEEHCMSVCGVDGHDHCSTCTWEKVITQFSPKESNEDSYVGGVDSWESEGGCGDTEGC